MNLKVHFIPGVFFYFVKEMHQLLAIGVVVAMLLLCSKQQLFTSDITIYR